MRRPGRSSLLLVSLTKPWPRDGTAEPTMCYKIAAAVVDMERISAERSPDGIPQRGPTAARSSAADGNTDQYG
jgi:hypothetical protein